MVIKYAFINDEIVEIEVSDDLWFKILQIDKDIKNNDRKETRRHQSFSEIIDKADMLIDKSINIDELILKNSKVDKLYEAISKLKPAEQELIHKLYLDKHPMTQGDYAKYLNIKETSVCQKAWRVKRKLKKLLKN